MRISKSAVSIFAAASIMLAPAMAFADNGTSVVNSGDHTNVTSSSNQTSNVAVTNSNVASIEQSVHASANTGGNTASKNIGSNGTGAAIGTGNASVGTMLGVSANNNATSINGAVAPSSANLTDVVNTGDHTNVNTSTNTSNTVGVSNSNYAGVGQSVNANANTGKNYANSNIGGGVIGTGAANVGTTMGVDVNHNATAIGGGLMGLSGAMGLVNGTDITNTGDHANVYSSANSNSNVGVSNANTAMVDQMIYGDANTGKNGASSNIGGGLIGTSGANVGSTFGVSANTNLTGLDEALMGMNGGMNAHDVINTGDHANSNTSVNSSSNLGVSNSQYLSSSQFEWTHTNTGTNHASSNIGGSGIGTGMANAGANFAVGGNTNLTGIGGMLGNLLSFAGLL